MYKKNIFYFWGKGHIWFSS